MKSSIKYGLVLFSVLMSLSLGVAVEAVTKNAINKTNVIMPDNATNTTIEVKK